MKDLKTMEERMILADFENETAILEESIERELALFDMETALIEKGVL